MQFVPQQLSTEGGFHSSEVWEILAWKGIGEG